MNNLKLFTLSSDNGNRFINLLCLLESNKAYDNMETYIIPFDDNMEITNYIAEVYENTNIYKVNPIFDEIGISIFGDSNYRQSVPNWRLFRKLNFIPDENNCDTHLFMDNNSVIMNSFKPFHSINEAIESYDLLFGARSVKGRTLSALGEVVTNALNPSVLNGFNAGLMLTNKSLFIDKFLQKSDFSHYRELISRAPEQGFLATYLGLMNLSCGTMSEVDRSFKAIISGNKVDLSRNNFKIGISNKINNRVPMVMKWSGHINLTGKKEVPNEKVLTDLLKLSLKRMRNSPKYDKKKEEYIIESINSFFDKDIA